MKSRAIGGTNFFIQESPQCCFPPSYTQSVQRQCEPDCVLLLRLRLRANPFLVGGHPIISNFPLCSRKEYFAAADLITIESFQPVLYVRVPLQARIRLRPKVLLLTQPWVTSQ